MAKGVSIKYSEKELKWLEKNKTLTRKESHKLFCNKFKRNDISIDNIKSLYNRRKWNTGRTGCFEKGNISFNKGKKWEDYVSKEGQENSRKTTFKKGNCPHNTKPLWDERITRDGYIEIKYKEDNYLTNYMLKHVCLWEKENGKLPKDCFLKCLDGNKENTNPSNWKCLPNSCKTFINGAVDGSINYDKAPKEIKESVLMLAKLNGKKSEIIKGIKQ